MGVLILAAMSGQGACPPLHQKERHDPPMHSMPTKQRMVGHGWVCASKVAQERLCERRAQVGLYVLAGATLLELSNGQAWPASIGAIMHIPRKHSSWASKAPLQAGKTDWSLRRGEQTKELSGQTGIISWENCPALFKSNSSPKARVS